MTAAAVIANYKMFWVALRATGAKVVQATIPPRTTTTDSNVTTKNQTAINSNFGPEVTGGAPGPAVPADQDAA